MKCHSKSKENINKTDNMKITAKGVEVLHKIIHEIRTNIKCNQHKQSVEKKSINYKNKELTNFKFQISNINLICRTNSKKKPNEQENTIYEKLNFKVNVNGSVPKMLKRSSSNYDFWKNRFNNINQILMKKMEKQLEQRNKQFNTHLIKKQYQNSMQELIQQINNKEQLLKKRNQMKLRKIYWKKFHRFSLFDKENKSNTTIENDRQPQLEIRIKNLSIKQKKLNKICIR